VLVVASAHFREVAADAGIPAGVIEAVRRISAMLAALTAGDSSQRNQGALGKWVNNATRGVD
jgi:hypothetical protein